MSRRKEVGLGNRLLREVREELARADGKASLLLAAASVIAVAVLTAILSGDWRPFLLLPCIQIFWWIGTASGVGAIVFLAVAVFPRTKYRKTRSEGIVAYYGDVVGLSKGELRRRLALSARHELAVEDQLLAVSDIVDKKYRSIQIGLWLFAVAAFLCSASVVLNRAIF